VTTYAEIGLFGGTAPDPNSVLGDMLITRVYDGAVVIWPAT